MKGVGIATNLALVPLTINYINPTQYGIWLTLCSIISWFSFFDIGFSNGLRNRFAEAKATGNYQKARIYVSTTYAVLTVIFTSVWIVFFVANYFVDWAKILNTQPELANELSTLALIVFSFFCLQVVLKTINTIVIADQKPALVGFFDMLGQLLALTIIYYLTKTTQGSLIKIGLTLSFVPLLALLSSSITLYKSKYKAFSPKFKYVDFNYTRDIISLGSKFFIIQIAVIVIYQTNNIIITQIGKPVDVTIFNIAYKYLSVALMGFMIIISPFWSAFTDAYIKKDYAWMKSTLKNLRRISYLIILAIFLLILIAKPVYEFWIGDSVQIPTNVTFFVGIYTILLSIVSLNTQILNGIGKIKIQLLTYSLAIVFHVPVAIFLGQKIGIIGVIISASIFYTIISICSIKQVNLLVSNRAKGIWNE